MRLPFRHTGLIGDYRGFLIKHKDMVQVGLRRIHFYFGRDGVDARLKYFEALAKRLIIRKAQLMNGMVAVKGDETDARVKTATRVFAPV